MELATGISLSISVVAVCITVIFGIAIWKKNNTDELRQERNDLQQKLEVCRRDLASQRDQNEWSLKRAQAAEARLEERRMVTRDKDT